MTTERGRAIVATVPRAFTRYTLLWLSTACVLAAYERGDDDAMERQMEYAMRLAGHDFGPGHWTNYIEPR